MSKKESIQEWWTKSNLRKTTFKNFEVKCFVYLDHIIPHRCFHKFYWSILESRILFLRLFFSSITSTITFFIATGKFWYSEVIYPTALTRQWCCHGLYRILNVLVDILRISEAATGGNFFKKAVLKNFAIFTWKRPLYESLKTCDFIKKRLQHRTFPKNIAQFLRTPILKSISKRLLLVFLEW